MNSMFNAERRYGSIYFCYKRFSKASFWYKMQLFFESRDGFFLVKENGKFWLKMQDTQNYEKHGCQNTAAMEISNCLGQDLSYKIVPM